MEVTSAALDDFKKLVEEHGISADTVIVNQNNGREKARWDGGDLREKTDECRLCFSQVSVFQTEQVSKDEAQRWKRTAKYMQHLYYRIAKTWGLTECDSSLLVKGITSILQVQ